MKPKQIKHFIFLFVMTVGFFTFSVGSLQAFETFTHDQVRIKMHDGEEVVFEVEMALTGSQHAQGLMFRKELPLNQGMLFMFGDEDQRSFWMKNTYVPLDILFLKKDGTISHIHHMAKPLDESRVTSEGESIAVLEINGGLADKLGIHEGMKVLHSSFHNTYQ